METASICPLCGAQIAVPTTVDRLCPSCLFARAFHPPAANEAPPLDERYAILNVLGEGPRGITYLAQARDTSHAPVALKMLKARRPTDEWSAHLQLYLMAASRIEGFGTANVIDVGVAAGDRGYVVTEFIAGQRMLAHCRRARLPLDARLRLFVDVCRTVDYAHRLGVYHGHLVQENVLVALGTGVNTRITDFGLEALSSVRRLHPGEDLEALGKMLAALLACGDAHGVDGSERNVGLSVRSAIATCVTAGGLATAVQALVDQRAAS